MHDYMQLRGVCVAARRGNVSADMVMCTVLLSALQAGRRVRGGAPDVHWGDMCRGF